MTPSALISYIRWKGDAPTTTPWDNASLLPFVNTAKDNVAAAIAQKNPDYFGETSTTATVLSQQEYTKPSDLMLFKRMDVSYTDTNVGSYYPARKVTLDELMPLGEDWYANNQPPQSPLIRFDDTGFFLYPYVGSTSSLSVGSAFIRLWYVPKRVDLTDLTDNTNDIETTTEIGSVFHELIADIVVNQIKYKKGELTAMDVQDNNAHILNVLVPQSFRQISTTKSSLPTDAWLQY